MLLRRSQRHRLLEARTFVWCTGIEDTFITAPSAKTGRTLDEYQLTDHYGRYAEDIAAMPELGVSAARYGIPWHRINPQRGVWDWEWTDRALDALLATGIEPIVDLVHYGLPPWIDGAFLNPDFPSYMAEYAGRVAERFKGRIHAYTPLNEPRITAWYCGRLGWWPPFERSWRGFVRVMLGVCRGIVQTTEALRAVDEDILAVHVDATDLYETDDPSLEDEARRRQDIVFLALDLVSGRIGAAHPLQAWLLRNGATESDLTWFQERAVDLPFVGLNLYPMFTLKKLKRSAAGRFRITMPYATGDIVARLGRLYWERYHSPLFISETASVGTLRRRSDWLASSVAATRVLREEGVPMVGYTWWPMFALVTWAYRQGHREPAYYLKQMGLWDLDAQLDRRRTRLVDEFRALATDLRKAVGDLRV